jgi:hypothetical protein
MTSYVGLPPALNPSITRTKDLFQALDNFTRVFAIRPGEKVLMLTDPLLDPRVVDAVTGLARSRGAEVRQYMEPTTQVLEVPIPVRALLEESDFVVSTWFCSIISPFCIGLRAKGQRWVKITYFRDLDLLYTPQARFPAELVGELIRATAARLPEDKFDLHFADEPGCYVHYLPTHGPNLWDRTAHGNDSDAPVTMRGTVYPEWAVGFGKPFAERIACEFEDDTVVEVRGDSEEARVLREMLIGGRLIELGCGFNPKAPRLTAYPAGSNAPGALHFGIDLAKPADYIRRVMPNWEEPPVHVDLITLDATVTAGKRPLVEHGFLSALKDEKVIEAARRYGDPVDLLEGGL